MEFKDRHLLPEERQGGQPGHRLCHEADRRKILLVRGRRDRQEAHRGKVLKHRGRKPMAPFR